MIVKKKILLSLCFTLVLVFVIGAIIIIGTINNVDTKSELKAQPPCTNCSQVAVDLSASINVSVNPCKNFYDFVCGGKVEGLNIETDKTGVGIIQNHQDYVHKKLQELLELSEDPNELNIFKHTKRFYHDCTDLGLLEERGEPSLLSVFAEAGGFPVLEPNWDEDKFSWENLTFKFLQLGLNIHYLFQASFSGHPSNSSIQQLFVSSLPCFSLQAVPFYKPQSFISRRSFISRAPFEPQLIL